MTKKAIIYARQSSGSDDYSESVARQIENCKALASKENIEVIGVYSDLNTSGKTYPAGSESIASIDHAFNTWFEQQTGSKKFRPGLEKALNQLARVDFLIVDDITRLYRPVRGSYLENFINNQLTAQNVKILQVKGGKIDLSQFDEALVSTIRSLINDEQIANGKMKSKQQLKARRDNGMFANGGGKAFGTFYDKNTGNITIKPEFVEVIKYIFNGIASYKPFMQLLRELNSTFNAIVPMFYASHIYNISANPVYCGYMRNSEGMLIANKQIVNPCISFAQWQEVNAIMDSRKTRKTNIKKRWLPLSGMIYCGNCGRKLLSGTDRTGTYYSCRITEYAGKPCKGSRINYSITNGKYAGLLEAIRPLLVIAYFDFLDKQEHQEQEQAKLDAMQVELANLNTKKENLMQMFIDSLISKDDLEKHLTAIKAKINDLNSKLIYAKTNTPDDCTLHLNSVYKKFKASDLMNGDIDNGTFEALLNASIKAIKVYSDKVEVDTIYGVVNIPRMMIKNKRNLPLPDLIINGRNELSCIIIYKTGKKGVLGDFGRVKVLTR